MATIFHNPRCSKSRQTLALLNQNGVDAEVVEYLKTSVSEAELKEILRMLNISPIDLIRKGEKLFKETYKGQELSDEQWIKIMVENPILIERPIVIKDGKAVIGRPPEKILEIL